MKWLICCGLALAFSVSTAWAEEEKTEDPMARLAFLVGEWEGTGWSQMGTPEREDTNVKETILSKLDGKVLLLEGRGFTGDEVTHHAFGMLIHDPQTDKYLMRSVLADGKFVDAEGGWEGEKFWWGFDMPQGTIRYTLWLDEEGRWIEEGNFSLDGESWTQFFAMTLSRVAGE